MNKMPIRELFNKLGLSDKLFDKVASVLKDTTNLPADERVKAISRRLEPIELAVLIEISVSHESRVALVTVERINKRGDASSNDDPLLFGQGGDA